MRGQTAATWLNPVDGSWTESLKWSTNPQFPNNGGGVTYAVNIPASVSPYAVTLSSNVAVNSIDLGANAQLLLNGGTLRATSISGAGTFMVLSGGVPGGGTLDAVSLGMSMRALNFNVRNGLTFTGSSGLLICDATLPNGDSGPNSYFVGTQSVTGTGTIVLNGDAMRIAPSSGTTQAVLTVGPNVTITNGTYGEYGYGAGTIEAYYSTYGKLVNQGVIWAKGGGHITFDTLSWTNQGTFKVTDNSSLQLGGSYSTSDIGTIQRSDNGAGTILLAGALNNTGQVLQTNATTGEYILGNGGIARGGTLRTRDATKFTIAFGAGSPSYTFDGVTLDGQVVQGVASQGLYITNGLNMLAGSSIVDPVFQGTQNVTGTGTLQDVRVDNGTLTLGLGITVNSGILGNPDPNYQGAVVSHGTIVNPTFLGFASPAGHFVSDGTIILNGGSVLFSGDWSNQQGHLQASLGATIRLEGAVSLAKLGTTSISNSQILLTGSLDNSGKTLLIDGQAGSITLGTSGLILGGTIQCINGGELKLTRTNSPGVGNAPTLSNLTLNGIARAIDLGFGLPTVSFNGNITLAPGSSVQMGRGGIMLLGSLLGSGEVWLGSVDGNVPALLGDTGTIGSGITMRVTPGPRATFAGTFTNQGIIWNEGGATTFTMDGIWHNAGILRVSAGTLELKGTRATADIGTIERSGGGVVNLLANLDNTATTLDMSSGGATWRMGAGTISGGTVTNSAGGSIPMSGSYLKTLTLAADIAINGTVRFDGVSIAGANIELQSGSPRLQLIDTNVLAGNATITVTGSGASIVGTPSSALTIGPSITIRAGASTFTVGGSSSGNVTNNGSILVNAPGGPVTFNGANQKLLRVSDGGLLRIGGSSFSNTGSILVDNGGILELTAPLLPTTVPGVVARSGTNIVDINYALNNTGQTLELSNTPIGPVDIGGGATITGGTLSSSTARPITVNRNAATFSGVTVSGDLSIENGASLTVNNGLLFAGTRSISAFRRDGLPDAPTAQVVLQAASGNFLRSDTGGITIASGITVRNANYTAGTVYTATIGSATTSVVNQGTVLARDNGTTLQLLGSQITNSGSFEALNRGVLSVGAAGLTNLSGQTLTGGSWVARADSTLDFGTFTISTNNASVTLDGSGSTFAALEPLSNNLGRFSVIGGRKFTTAGSLSNSGAIVIASGTTSSSTSAIKVAGALQNSGSIDMNGALIVDYTGASPLAALASQIGSGIFTTDGAADPRKRIGYAEASALNIVSFATLPVDGTTALFKLTSGGDSNLDGRVDVNDLANLAFHWQGPADWFGGDFDYNGIVNALDLGILASNWQAGAGSGGSGLSEALASLGLSQAEVPEPALPILSVLAGFFGYGRRARGRRT